MLSVFENLFNASPDKNVQAETAEPNVLPEWISDHEGIVDWGIFYDSELMQSWARGLVSCAQSGSREEWLLQGPNVLVVGDEVATLSDLIQMGACQAGFRHLRIPVSAALELISNPRKIFENLGKLCTSQPKLSSCVK